jgi:multiple RNA-binding domain-containing protein 1
VETPNVLATSLALSIETRRPLLKKNSMSRLIVKGLPKRYDERLLRDLFACGGDVTDAKVMRTADGRSRQFGFVGFRSKAEAQRACQCLNRTYVDAAQISVEAARPVGDAEIPRPWSKYSQGSSRHDGPNSAPPGAPHGASPGKTDEQRLQRHAKDQSQLHGGGNDATQRPSSDRDWVAKDPAFQEFKDVVAKRSKNPLWADGAHRPQENVHKSMVASKKTGGEGILLERSHVVFDDGGEDSQDEDDNLYEDLDVNRGEDEKGHGLDTEKPVAFDKEDATDDHATARDNDVDDMSYFKSKVRKHMDLEDDALPSNQPSLRDGSEEDDETSDDSVGADSALDDVDAESSEAVIGADVDGKLQSHGKEIPPVISHIDSVQHRRPASRFDKEEKADASETGRLFLRNLAYTVTEDELESLFEPFGAIADIHLVQDPQTKQSRGVAFILYVVPENAVKALTALDGTVVSGRLLHILPGKPRPQTQNGGIGVREAPVGANSFKLERELARKESAKSGSDSAAYNAMYMSSDAVAGVMADRYGLSKADIYGTGRGDSGAAAVRLAAGEAKIQGESRAFLLSNGIDMQLAQEASRDVRRKKLSRTAFLVKNFPARTTEAELESIFSNYGSLDRLLIVPSGLLAVVVFTSANDAKMAYMSLAYTRMKGTPLYLEWLPSAAVIGEASKPRGVLTTSPPSDATELGASSKNRKADERTEELEGACGELDDSLPRLSVFVKNLNFDTRDEALRKHFAKVLRKQPKVALAIRAAVVSTRSNPKDPSGPRLSYGFGFVEFASEHCAAEAVKLAQGSMLDGHALELRIANRQTGVEKSRKRGATGPTKRKPSSKLVVRNIAFEATARDIRQLFGTFGQLKSVRVPKRQDGSHRGFGFVEFVSKNEAAHALNSLSASHLYGRHLVIEFAEETADGYGSLEELQAKAAQQVAKRRKIEGQGLQGARSDSNALDDDHQQMMDEMYS